MLDFTDLTGWGPNEAVQWLNTHATRKSVDRCGRCEHHTWNIAMTVEVLAKSSPSGKRKAALPHLRELEMKSSYPGAAHAVVTIADRAAGINRLIGQTFLRAFQLPVR